MNDWQKLLQEIRTNPSEELVKDAVGIVSDMESDLQSAVVAAIQTLQLDPVLVSTISSVALRDGNGRSLGKRR